MRRAGTWAGVAAIALAGGCRTAPSPGGGSSQGPGQVLADFIAAADAQDFERAYLMLCGDLRARYTPGRLRRDFEEEPLARERLERARQALRQGATLRGDVAEFSVGAGKAVRLVREGGVFRVAALE